MFKHLFPFLDEDAGGGAGGDSTGSTGTGGAGAANQAGASGDTGTATGQGAGTGNAGQGQGTAGTQVTTDKTFTQADMDRIAGDRALRERKKYESFERAYQRLVEQGVIAQGVTPDQLLAHLEQQQQAEQARQRGMDPAVHAALTASEQRAKKAEDSVTDIRLDLEQDRLKSDPVFTGVKDTEWEAARKLVKTGVSLPDGSPMTLGRALVALLGPDALKSVKARAEAETEQRVIASIQERGGIRVESGDGGATGGEKVDLTADERRIAERMGVSPADYAAMKSINNLDDYQTHRQRTKR